MSDSIKPDFHVIVIPHNLERDWNIPKYVKYIERIESLYLFDKNVHVHCCEITPSYELWPITTRPVFKQEVFGLDDNMVDKIDDIVHVASCESDVEYHHVRFIDALMVKHPERWTAVNPKWNVVEEDETYEENREALIEYYQCNECI